MEAIFILIVVAFFFYLIRGAQIYDASNEEEAKMLNAISGGNYRLRGPEIHKFRREYLDWDNLTKFEKSNLVKQHYVR